MSSVEQGSGQVRPVSGGASSAQTVTGSQALGGSGIQERRMLPGDVGQFTVDWELPAARSSDR